MNNLQKFTWYLGLGMGITVFALFLHSYLPHMINNYDWEQVEKTLISTDYMKNQLESHSSFKAFKERYPDATIEFAKGKRGVSYELAIGNFTSNTSLILTMDYQGYEGKTRVDVSCKLFDNSIRGTNISGALATQYIKENTCMEFGVTGPVIKTGNLKIYSDEIIIEE